MTPQERFKKTVAHKQPDRPPIMLSVVPEVDIRLTDHFQRHFGTSDIEQVLEVDLHQIWPPRRNAWTTTSSADASTQPSLPSGYYQDTQSLPLAWIQSLDDVKRFHPECDPDDYDFSGFPEMLKAQLPFVRVFGTPGLVDIVNGLGARGRGLENILCEIMTEDEVTVAMIDKHLEYALEFCRRGLEAGKGQIEMLWIGEDCGHQRGPLFPPAFFKKFFVPRLRRFVDLAHKYHAVCMMHSCGSIRQLLPILIDDVGLDIQDACQPEAEGMEPESLKRDFGDRITFCGMLSLQHTMTFGSVEDCRREAEHRINVIGKGGGYIFAPCNTITNDTPLENILAVYEVACGKELMAKSGTRADNPR